LHYFGRFSAPPSHPATDQKGSFLAMASKRSSSSASRNTRKHLPATKALDVAYPFIANPATGGGWDIVVPDLPGCTGWAGSWEEVGTVARAVVRDYVQSIGADGLLAPAPTSLVMMLPDLPDLPMDPDANLMTLNEIAEECGISPRQVSAIAERQGIRVHKVGRNNAIAAMALGAFRTARTRKRSAA
jgi:predicted RNase H-like HicB family nuclease